MAKVGDRVQIEGVVVDRLHIGGDKYDVQIKCGDARYWVDERFARKPAKAQKPAEDKQITEPDETGAVYPTAAETK